MTQVLRPNSLCSCRVPCKPDAKPRSGAGRRRASAPPGRHALVRCNMPDLVQSSRGEHTPSRVEHHLGWLAVAEFATARKNHGLENPGSVCHDETEIIGGVP